MMMGQIMFVYFMLCGGHLPCVECWVVFRALRNASPINLVTCGLDSTPPNTTYAKVKTQFNLCSHMHKQENVKQRHYLGEHSIHKDKHHNIHMH